MPFEIDWEGLIVGFESRSHKITHFFDRQTGDVVQVLEKDAQRDGLAQALSLRDLRSQDRRA